MDRYEAIEVLLEMARDLLAIEQAAGFEDESFPYVEEAIRVVDDMLEEDRA